MQINTTFVKFHETDGTEILIAIDDLIFSGRPVDAENGEDLELVDENIYRGDGSIVE